MRKQTFHTVLLSAILVIGCNPVETTRETIDKETVKQEVLGFMASYKQAILNSDVDSLTAHYLDDPEFAFYSRNQFHNYQSMLENIKIDFQEWTYSGEIYRDPQVNVLGNTEAVFYSDMVFTGTLSSGEVMDVEGGVIYVLVKRDGGWKIVHGIGSYKPEGK